ncbi:hypothetical protein OS493_037907 [Desmophyllum pertusum]|uniref:Uncharacterized protein n=1 Tax=Desmophyllum pertusum TaxID=174260 RepID=A0A9X0CWG3_9CNID|nr:hypothetical protein OS493_037907 [Desmophyllum pertusum]
MKIFILSLCVAAALGCTNLPKLETCNKSKLIYQGKTIPVKQCMPESLDIEVETVDLDNQVADAPMRNKRWLFNACTSEAECQANYCCAFGKRCAPKLPEYMTCFLVNKHKCGCGAGLTCKVTTTIKLPLGILFPIKQCVKPAA